MWRKGSCGKSGASLGEDAQLCGKGDGLSATLAVELAIDIVDTALQRAQGDV